MKLKRAVYLVYYLKQLDREKFNLFLNYTSELTGKPKIAILSDIVKSVFIYNISILEYFQFYFYKLSKQERASWAGTGHMYEYQLVMKPKNNREILENKALFYRYYKDFIVHKVADIEDLKKKPAVADAILSNASGKLVFKSADGNCGAEVEIRNCKDFGWQSVIEYMEDSVYEVIEEFIEQHRELNRLSPSAVNTVRICTQLNEEGETDILGCRLRISVNSPVDNMAAGNLAAPIDEGTGQLSGPAVYSDITKPEQEYHPVTRVKIPGFQIPFWEETINMVKKAAKMHPQNKSIDWDIVITEK